MSPFRWEFAQRLRSASGQRAGFGQRAGVGQRDGIRFHRLLRAGGLNVPVATCARSRKMCSSKCRIAAGVSVPQ
jgi:hypothetical protein